jgi:protocatechuate 3,4-dioxygenase beta subunit
MQINAQQISITGRVIDTSQNAVPYATVTLLRLKDSSVVRRAQADTAGYYQFRHILPGQLWHTDIGGRHARSFLARLYCGCRAKNFYSRPDHSACGGQHIALDISTGAGGGKLSEIKRKRSEEENRL